VEKIKGVDGQAITYIMPIKDEQENNTSKFTYKIQLQ
jgi:hypothetical protein